MKTKKEVFHSILSVQTLGANSMKLLLLPEEGIGVWLAKELRVTEDMGLEVNEKLALEGAIFKTDLLCFKWLFTKCPAARADIRDNSLATTVEQIIRAKVQALSPGLSWQAPRTPNISRQAA